MIVFRRLREWIPYSVLGPLFLAIIVLVIPLAFKEVDPSISLVKNEWECSQSVLKNNTTFVLSENVMVPITFQDVHCIQWTKKGY